MSNNKGTQTILWWIGWITLTIVSFFVASAFWTPWIAENVGSIRETKNAVIWVAAVFGTWMLFLLPLIIFMYQKVDKAYEDARIRREKAEMQFRSINIDKAKRMLPENVSKKLAGIPETIEGGHLVSLKLKSGQEIESAFVAGGNELLGIYDAKELTFDIADIVDIKIIDMDKNPPSFFTTNWLRLDGIEAQV